MHYLIQIDETPDVNCRLYFLYALQARNAQKNNMLEQVWYLLSRSTYYQVLFSYMQRNASVVQKQRKAARRENLRPVKERFVQLLQAKMPTGSWKSQRIAIEATEKALQEFIKIHRIRLVATNLPNTMRAWLRSDEYVSAEYAKLKAVRQTA